VDKAIQFIADAKQVAPIKPFFMYFCPGAMHASLITFLKNGQTNIKASSMTVGKLTGREYHPGRRNWVSSQKTPSYLAMIRISGPGTNVPLRRKNYTLV